jgi:hypothetical protein
MKTEQSDVWVLNSICLCTSKGATLRDIIGAGDYIEHAIMTKDELFGGLKRLHKAGLLIQKGDRYKLAPRVAAAYRRILKKTRRRYLLRSLIRSYLERVKAKKPIGTLGRLTKKAYDKALKEYRKGF